MSLKIRLRRQGKKNSPFSRLVLTESRNPRDGKYIEALGWYNPFETEIEKSFSVQADRVSYWLEKGAIISESAEALLKKSCPQVVQAYRQRKLAKAAKMCEKRRLAKKKTAKAAAPTAEKKKPAAKKTATKEKVKK